jgi:hypothetical protein
VSLRAAGFPADRFVVDFVATKIATDGQQKGVDDGEKRLNFCAHKPFLLLKQVLLAKDKLDKSTLLLYSRNLFRRFICLELCNCQKLPPTENK